MRYLHHNNVDALLWLQTSAEWYASYVQAYALARFRIEAAAQIAQPGAKLCIISDLDETLFDNSAYNEYLVRTGRLFNELGSWDRYCRRQISLAMPGVEDFYGWLAKAHPGIEVFFVTSRRCSLRKETAANLAKFANVPTRDCDSTDVAVTHLFMQGTKVPSGRDKKYDQYQYIQADRGYEVILWLGDNSSDFDADFGSGIAPAQRLANAKAKTAEWGQRWIQMPNPVYGSYLLSMKAVEDESFDEPASDDVVRERRTPATTPKVSFLDPWDGKPPT